MRSAGRSGGISKNKASPNGDADVHQGPKDPFLSRRICRGFQIPVLYGVLFELFYQIIQALVLVHGRTLSVLLILQSNAALTIFQFFLIQEGEDA